MSCVLRRIPCLLEVYCSTRSHCTSNDATRDFLDEAHRRALSNESYDVHQDNPDKVPCPRTVHMSLSLVEELNLLLLHLLEVRTEVRLEGVNLLCNLGGQLEGVGEGRESLVDRSKGKVPQGGSDGRRGAESGSELTSLY